MQNLFLNGSENIMALGFNKQFNPVYGQADQLSPLIRRMTAPNASPYTFKGTNTYLIGQEHIALIDPGPDDEQHIAAIIREIGDSHVAYILLTHAHIDHTPAAQYLRHHYKAPIMSGAIAPFMTIAGHEIETASSSMDYTVKPDALLDEDRPIITPEWRLDPIHTPGHTTDHYAFALESENSLLSGDHVMGWSTTVIAPPQGAMHDYMASLDKLLKRSDQLYFPGHGGEISKPQDFVRGLKTHRKMRERAIIDRLEKGDTKIEQIVASIYRDIPQNLRQAAASSIFAHLLDLMTQERVTTQGRPQLDGVYIKR